MQEILKVEDVTSGYGEIVIVEKASMDVGTGEIVTIVGPNGSGKSTLLKTIAGLVRLFSGRITFQGDEITMVRPDRLAKMGVSYIPQVDNIFTSLSVRENLEMGAYTLEHEEVNQAMEEVFTIFPELKSYEDRKAGTLSGGERQMLAISRGLMIGPKFLIVDEPTANLAPQAVARVHDKIKEIRDREISVLMVEQNAKKALQISDRGYIMISGNLVFEGTPQRVIEKIEKEKIYFRRS